MLHHKSAASCGEYIPKGIKEGLFDTPAVYHKKALALNARGELYAAAEEIAADRVINKGNGEDAQKPKTPLERAKANVAQLDWIVSNNPHVKRYFELGGRVEITREGFSLPKRSVAYTRDGVVLEAPRACYMAGIKDIYGGEKLTPDALPLSIGKNRAVVRFADLSAEKLVKRMARRIDPRSIK
jgi:hypothetical protein